MIKKQTLQYIVECERAIQSFFDSRGYLSCRVPVLSPRIIPESTIPVFRTQLEDPDSDAVNNELYLLPSPELYLKRLLAGGIGNLYSLSPCFRNREFPSTKHRWEFTMLEFYTVGAGAKDSIFLTLDLIQELPRSSIRSPLFEPPEIMTMAQAWKTFGALDLWAIADFPDTPEGDTQALQEVRTLLTARGISWQPEDTWDDCFQRLFIQFVEPEFPQDHPLIITDFPWRIPTTAKRQPMSPWAERWEMYLGQLELGNVYTEEDEPEAAMKYLEKEIQRFQSMEYPPTWDQDYPRIAGSLPLCSGAAFGFERLVMAAGGFTTIDQLVISL
jgi:lysyl-tRNA synthetase class 2